MPIIFRYFWFLCAAVMAINVMIWRRRLLAVVDRGVATRVEVDRFTKWAAAWFVGVPLVAEFIALGAGWSTPFCAGILAFGDVPRSLMSILTIASWLALLWWVWRGNGADFLARVAPALARRPREARQFSPGLVRWALTAFVVISAVGGTIAWRTMPRDPVLECPAPTRTQPSA